MDRRRRLDRAAVRAAFERRFTAQRMASEYLEVYKRLCSDGTGMAPDNRRAILPLTA